MDIIVKKQLGYLIAGIWGAWGFAILALLLNIATSTLWIITIEGTWYAIDAFIVFFIHYYFNVVIKTPEEMLEQLLIDLNKTIPLVSPEAYQQIREKLKLK